MDQSKINKIEELRGKRFNADEINRLVGRKHAFGVYWAEHKALLESQYGSGEEAKDLFLQDLGQRLRLTEDFIAIRKVEESLMTRQEKGIRKNLDKIGKDVRKDVLRATKGHEILDETTLQHIRTADDRAIREGSFEVTESTINAYMELVRDEVRKQMRKMTSIEKKEEGPEKQILERDLYQKSNNIIDFIVSNTEESLEEKRFLKAFLMKKICTDGVIFIKTLYQEVKKIIADKDTSQWRPSIAKAITRFKGDGDYNKAQQIKAVLWSQNPDVKVSLDDVSAMLSYGPTDLGYSSYSEELALRIEEIESRRLEIITLKMTPKDELDPAVRQERIKAQNDIIKENADELKKIIDQFNDKKKSIEYVVDHQHKDLEFSKRFRLKALGGSLERIAKDPEKIRAQIAKLKNEKAVDEFLVKAEEKVTAHLVKQGCDPEMLERMKRNNPDFDLSTFLRERERYKEAAYEIESGRPIPPELDSLADTVQKPERKITKKEEKALETNPYLHGEPLGDIQSQVAIMNQICLRNFSKPKDLETFDKANAAIENLQKNEFYRIDEVVNNELGKPEFEEYLEDGKKKRRQKIRPAKEQKKLPYDIESMLQSMTLQRQHHEKFKKSRKKLLSLKDDEKDPGKISEALTAIYGEMNEWTNETQVKKLTKVMSVDHPLTALRFNAATKKPFLSSDGKRYQLLDGKGHPTLTGEPKTFQQRAREILKVAKSSVAQGNYSQLSMIFRRGEMGDRLYLDAAFFPVKMLKGKENAERMAILYELGEDDDGKVIPTRRSEKLPSTYPHFFDLNDDSRKRDEEICEDSKLIELPDCLADDVEFHSAMRIDPKTQQTIKDYQEAMVYDEKTGKTTVDLKKLAELVQKNKKIMGAGARTEAEELEGLKITKERLDEIAKDHPLIAARAAMLNSEAGGALLAMPQLAARKMIDALKMPYKLGQWYGENYWKGMLFFSPMSIYFAVEQAVEHISALADFRVKFKAYWLMQNMFKGTIIGTEFERLLQNKENERVDEFKKAFDQYGNEAILDKLKNARDRFEFKQTLNQGLQERGLFTTDDFVDRDVIKTLNKYNPNYTVPMSLFDTYEKSGKEEDKQAVMEEIKKAIDAWWGQGQWLGWKSAGVAKYESNKKQSFDNFKQNSGKQKEATFKKYWKMLSTDDGIKELRNKHPAEIVGTIDHDMTVGDRDSGETFALMQAMICAGLVKHEHLIRLQLTDHVNDLPIYALLEPKQAELCGLTDAWKKYRTCGYNAYQASEPKNPFMGFYQGTNALPLKGVWAKGKWRFPRSKEEYDEEEKNGNVQEIYVTVHELQKSRETQTFPFKKMDNSAAGIFQSTYDWSIIQANMQMDQQGKIGQEVRPHDMCAAYRGFHQKFAAYMSSLTDKEVIDHTTPQGKLKFLRGIWDAYSAMSKSCAFAGYFSRQVGRGKDGAAPDYNYNSFDGSPEFDNIHVEKYAKSGKTNFEEQIISLTGGTQRMGESNALLDSMKEPSMSDELRLAFKKMTGYQHVVDLGSSTLPFEPFDLKTFDPAKAFRDSVMPAFMEQVLKIAADRSPEFAAEVAKSLQGSGLNNFNIGSKAREAKIQKWRATDAGMGASGGLEVRRTAGQSVGEALRAARQAA